MQFIYTLAKFVLLSVSPRISAVFTPPPANVSGGWGREREVGKGKGEAKKNVNELGVQTERV